MRTTRRLTAAGAAAVGLALLASPAFAGNGAGPGDGAGADGSCTESGDAFGPAAGRGAGNSAVGLGGDGSGDGEGYGARSGAGDRTRARDGDARGVVGLADLPMGELTPEQEDALAFWVQEEKVAHDLYAAFAEQYDGELFARIARAENRHLDAVRNLLEQYGIADPTAGGAPGEVQDDDLAATYASLLEQGSVSYAAALEVGQEVERDDLEVLAELATDVTAPDVDAVIAKQQTASARHLEAFGG